MEIPPVDPPDGRPGCERFAGWYAVGVGLIHLGLLVWGAVIHGPGWDEVGHLAAGLSHWQTSRMDQYRVNPPLVRMLATAPLAFEDPGIEFKINNQYNLGRPEFDAGGDLIRKHKQGYLWWLRTARLACLPLAMLALWMVWRWSRELFGPGGGALSVTIWAFSPLVLTNAHLITPDLGAAAVGTAACYTFRRWLLRGTPRLAFLSGVLLGAALLTKFTWLLLAGLWPAQWLVHRLILAAPSQEDGAGTLPTVGQALLLVGVSWFVVNLGYGFEGSFERLDGYSFFSRSLTGLPESARDQDPPMGNRFAGTVWGRVPVPLPRNMLLGVDRQKVDFESKMYSYLRGEWRDHGWWYYYLYGTLVKEPVPFLLLGLLAAVSCFRIRWTRTGVTEGIHLLAPGAALFAFVSSQTGFNHHLRYVLPAFPFAAIGIGILGAPITRPFRGLRYLSVGLAVVGVAASVSSSPHWHSYFNILVGGPRNGPLHLLDSNVDWGQDLLLLERWVKAHPELPLDGVQHALPHWLGPSSLVDVVKSVVPEGRPIKFKGTEPVPREMYDRGPEPGRYAVSVRSIYGRETGYEYFRELRPIALIGWTMYVYEVTAEDADRIRRNLGYDPRAEQ